MHYYRSIFSQRRHPSKLPSEYHGPERKSYVVFERERENVSFLIHLLRGLTVSLFLFTYSEDSLVSRTQPISITRVNLLYPYSQQNHSNVTEILNSRFALEHRYADKDGNTVPKSEIKENTGIKLESFIFDIFSKLNVLRV